MGATAVEAMQPYYASAAVSDNIKLNRSLRFVVHVRRATVTCLCAGHFLYSCSIPLVLYDHSIVSDSNAFTYVVAANEHCLPVACNTFRESCSFST